MSRLLTKTQEQEIFKAVPSSFTIENKSITASKKYPNQMTDEHSTYPVITLNYSQDGLPGPIDDLESGSPYYQSMLTVHILAQDSSGLSGPVVARGIAQSVMTSVATWITPITGDVRIFDPESDIHPIQNLGAMTNDRSVFDYALSIDIYHS